MRIAKNILIGALISILVVMFGGLAGWYLYLRSQTESTRITDTARGIATDSPIFSGTIGSTATHANPSVPQKNATSSSSVTMPIQRLWQVTRSPIAGMAFDVPNTTSTSSDIFFVERATGYVSKASARDQKTIRLTNTLFPKTYAALLIPTKKTVFLRSLSGSGAITTFVGQFATSSATSSAPVPLLGRDMPTNITRIVVDQKSNTIAYLVPRQDQFGATVWTADWSGNKQKQVFSSPLSSWLLSTVRSQIILTATPADNMPGYAYTLRNGSLSPLLGPLPGLQILPHPTEDAMLYSSSQRGVLSLFVRLGKKSATALSVRTVAEKCVWAPGRSFRIYCAVPTNTPSDGFLNDWFRGAIHTADTWWELDTLGETATMIYTMPRVLDVQNPTIDPTGSYIAFLSGIDQSLWILRTTE